MERHRLDGISLAFGVLFLAVGLAVLTDTWQVARLWTPELWPALLVLVGLWLLATTARRRDDAGAGGDEQAPEGDRGDHERDTESLPGA